MERKSAGQVYSLRIGPLSVCCARRANFRCARRFPDRHAERRKSRSSNILESEGNQESADDKFNRVDIKALNSKGEIILVEIQNTRELPYLERILYGVAKSHHRTISRLAKGMENQESLLHQHPLFRYWYRGQTISITAKIIFVGVHTGDHLRVKHT